MHLLAVGGLFYYSFLHSVHLGTWVFYPHSILRYLMLPSSLVHHSLDVFLACALCSLPATFIWCVGRSVHNCLDFCVVASCFSHAHLFYSCHVVYVVVLYSAWMC